MSECSLLAKRFVVYHLFNPETWAAYEAATLGAIKSGKGKLGVGAITEMLRWEDFDVGDKAEGYRLSNSFRAFYARMFASAYPEHDGLFVYKKSTADYIDYDALLKGDAKGALNWEDPQLDLPLEA